MRFWFGPRSQSRLCEGGRSNPRPGSGEDGQGLHRAGVAERVRARRAGGAAIGAAEHVRHGPVRQDRRRLLGDGRLPVLGGVGEEVLAGVRIGFRDVVRVADQLGEGRRDAGEGLVVGVARLGLIGLADPRAEAVRELRRVAVGDEAILQGQQALLGQRQQRRLLRGSALDVARHRQVRGEGRLARRALRQTRDGGKAAQGAEVGLALRQRRTDTVRHRAASPRAGRCLMLRSAGLPAA